MLVRIIERKSQSIETVLALRDVTAHKVAVGIRFAF